MHPGKEIASSAMPSYFFRLFHPHVLHPIICIISLSHQSLITVISSRKKTLSLCVKTYVQVN